MIEMRLGHIAKAVGADFAGAEDAIIGSVSKNSKELPEGCLFVAIRGENFDGHDFIAEALRGGAAFAVAGRDGDWPRDRVLRVADARMAYMDIARECRRSVNPKVVAVTGSVGKTTTKEMAACVAAAKYNTLKTFANLNNEIGVSETLLQLEPECEAAVIEIGVDGPGQMAPISRTAEPDIAIITNIGVSHLEAFGTRESILGEKLDIRAGLKPDAPLILSADNDLLSGAKILNRPVMYFGIESAGCDVRAEKIREFATHTNFEIVYLQNRYDAQIPCIGRHNVGNALAAFCAGQCLGVEPELCAAALKNYRPAGMRQNTVAHNSYTIVEDCYNSSPDSLRAALETLGNLVCDGRRIAVLSDMLELGPVEESAHFEAGETAAARGIDYLLCTGPRSRLTVDAAKGAGLADAYYFETQDELFGFLKSLLRQGDTAWFKASRGMKLEQVIRRIYKEC